MTKEVLGTATLFDFDLEDNNVSEKDDALEEAQREHATAADKGAQVAADVKRDLKKTEGCPGLLGRNRHVDCGESGPCRWR